MISFKQNNIIACVWPGHIEKICSHREEVISVVENGDQTGNSNYVSANSQLAIHNDLFQLIVNNFQSPPVLDKLEEKGYNDNYKDPYLRLF